MHPHDLRNPPIWLLLFVPKRYATLSQLIAALRFSKVTLLRNGDMSAAIRCEVLLDQARVPLLSLAWLVCTCATK